jgi:hypothetical protein
MNHFPLDYLRRNLNLREPKAVPAPFKEYCWHMCGTDVRVLNDRTVLSGPRARRQKLIPPSAGLPSSIRPAAIMPVEQIRGGNARARLKPAGSYNNCRLCHRSAQGDP